MTRARLLGFWQPLKIQGTIALSCTYSCSKSPPRQMEASSPLIASQFIAHKILSGVVNTRELLHHEFASFCSMLESTTFDGGASTFWPGTLLPSLCSSAWLWLFCRGAILYCRPRQSSLVEACCYYSSVTSSSSVGRRLKLAASVQLLERRRRRPHRNR